MTDNKTLSTNTAAPGGGGSDATDGIGTSSNYFKQNVSGVGPAASSALAAPINFAGLRGLGALAFIIAQVILKVKALKIAKNYYKTNKKDFDYFVRTYQPAQTASVSEVTSLSLNPKYIPDTYASAPAGMGTAKVVDRKWFESRRRMNRYNTGSQRRIDYDFAMLRTAALVSGWNMGLRYEQSWADAHNERRINKIVSMANVGITAGNIVRQGLATAVEGLQNATNSAGDALAAVGNGYFESKGDAAGTKYVKDRIASDTANVRTNIGPR